MDYCIAQNFWGSKFLQMAVFEHFVEIISQIRCQSCARRNINVVWAWHTSKFYLIRTVHTVFHTRTRICQQSNAYFECIYLFGERSLWIWQHSPGMLSIDTLARQNCSSRMCRKIANGWKFANIVKLKTHENLALYGMQGSSSCELSGVWAWD